MSSTIKDEESVVPQTSSDPIEDAQSVAIPPPNKFWHAPWTFVVHGIVGTLIFTIIALFAVGLDLLVRWLEATDQISPLIIIGLQAAEYTLFSADLYLFVVFLWFTVKRTINDMACQ